MKSNIIRINVWLLILWPFCVFGNQSGDNAKLTESFKENWPYEAFWAIPRISELKPIVSIQLVDFKEEKIEIKCIELDYFEARKKFDSEAVLDRQPLHRLLCKTVKRAIQKSRHSEFSDLFDESEIVGLKFDFSNGRVEFAEIPYPPLDPYTRLEDFFVDENHQNKFGDIDFPSEYVSEIKETTL